MHSHFRTRDAGRRRRRPGIAAFALAAAASLVFGATLFVALKDTLLISARWLLACYTLALGAALLAAGWRRRRASAS